MIRFRTEVMLAWKIMFGVLVLESDSSAEDSPGIFNELSSFLNDNLLKRNPSSYRKVCVTHKKYINFGEHSLQISQNTTTIVNSWI
jgi:hypothetical protein